MRQLLSIFYASIRRLGVLDVTRLMHVSAIQGDGEVCPSGYEIRNAHVGELAELMNSGLAPEQLGDPDEIDGTRRAAILTFHEGRVVSFLWLAKDNVRGEDNFSRSPHLGTSIDMPDGAGFVYNAWTDPEHRGKRLIAAMLHWATDNRVMGTTSLLTMIDWTNSQSIRAFQHLGMQSLGSIYRVGRGPLQISVLPKSASNVGLRLATDAPGVKVSC
jgi:RimJ/RimL family protein N-acetyltransferase